MAGIFIFLFYGIILYSIYFAVAKKRIKKDLNSMIFSEGRLSSKVLIPGIFNSWLWTTSIIGAAEACLVYGFYGGFSFAIGRGIGVGAAVFLVVKFRKIMNGHIFITDFVRGRFCKNTEFLFFSAIILLVSYAIVEQAVGVGSFFSALFGLPFKETAFIAIAAAFIFVVFAGFKGVVWNDILSFIAIIFSMVCLMVFICRNFEAFDFIKNLYKIEFAPGQENAGFLSPSLCLRYGISAALIAFSHMLLDPAYYLKAHVAKDEKTFIKSFFVGGIVLWIPFVIVSSLIFGYVLTGFGASYQTSMSMGKIISETFINGSSAFIIRLLFGIFIMLIAFTSMINSIMGVWGISSLKIYPKYANNEADNRQKLNYGALLTAIIALICALISISLEQISLFTIDSFSGIFFSTPAGILLCGFYGKKQYGTWAVYAFVAGLVSGFVVWIYFKSTTVGYFYATVASFFVPMVMLFVMSKIKKSDDFNFASLKFDNNFNK